MRFQPLPPQIRTVQARTLQRLPVLPFFNGGVVAAQQNLRNSQAPEHVRLGIGGSLQQTVGKRFLHGRTLIPQHAGNQARYGVNYHHILNPDTGWPYQNGLASVTIVSEDSADGDALSTVCFSLGLEQGLELADSLPDVWAYFITEDGEIHYSEGALELVAKQ